MHRRDLLVGMSAAAFVPRAAGAKAKANVHALHVDDSALSVHIGDDPPVAEATIMSWVKRSSQMVVEYFGRFPVPTLKVEIVTGGGGGLGWGQHFRGRRLEIHAGQMTTPAAIKRDWVMVHEMMHCAFPFLARKHRWLREGLSTYLESVVRARASVMAPDEVWDRWISRMPEGLPRGRGFDVDRSWGSVYWGGAIFWFMVDVTLRARTAERKQPVTLELALRHILRTLGNSRVQRPVARVMAEGDKATKTKVFTELYDAFGRRGAPIDLDAFFARLGVSKRGERVVYDDEAPIAAVTKALYQPKYTLPPLK